MAAMSRDELELTVRRRALVSDGRIEGREVVFVVVVVAVAVAAAAAAAVAAAASAVMVAVGVGAASSGMAKILPDISLS